MIHSRFANLLVLYFIVGCAKPPEYPFAPVIKYEGINKTVIAQGNAQAEEDYLIITFSFTDGDGDISFERDSIDVFLTDSRDGTRIPYRLPTISTQGVGNGISGNITIRILNKLQICCTFPNGATPCTKSTIFPTDTFSYFIQMRDRAGNWSNTEQTDVVTVLCQ
jgi:hypothetical protein